MVCDTHALRTRNAHAFLYLLATSPLQLEGHQTGEWSATHTRSEPGTPKPLLTPTEARFYQCLAQVSGDRCRIQVKPRLADVFQHAKGDLSGFNKVSQKHIDFLICRNDDWMPMLAIELDDDSHERKERKVRDMFVNNLFASTGIPLLRIHVREVEQVERMVQKLTQGWLQRWAALESRRTV